MITQLNLKGETRIVKEHEVAHLTVCGWNLVAMIVVSEAVPLLPMNEYGRFDRPNNGHYSDTPMKVETVLGTSIRCVMAKDPDVTLAERTARIDQLVEAHNELERGLRKAQEELAAANLKIDEKEKARARLCAKELDLEKAAGEDRERSRKMEADISKIRSAIGAIRMKEILEC